MLVERFLAIKIILLSVLALVFLGCSNDKTPEAPKSKEATVLGVEKDIPAPDSEGKPPIYDKKTPNAFNLLAKSQMSDVERHCRKSLKRVPNPLSAKDIKSICSKVSQEKSCYSHNNQPIFHYDRTGTSKKGKRILTISLIHGDEHASGTVGARWMNRLSGIEPRNSWRVIPVVNPDGWDKKTRVNSRGVDINRNFPSKDWDELALNWWKTKKNSDPRRYPGPKASSERETECLIKQIQDFQPDFIIAIHTPLGLLDFDGPNVETPKKLPFKWHRLGNFPGSLGRYMWKDHNVPVLTIELKGSNGISRLERFDHLQDISGTVAMRASKILDKDKKKN